MKLQDAYASETGAAGTWKLIGYIAPGAKDASNDKKYSTNVFDYTDEFTGTTNNTTMVNQLSSNADGWKAEAKTALNDCGIKSTWEMSFKQSGTGDALAYTAKIVPAANSDSTSCASLTAIFGNIAHHYSLKYYKTSKALPSGGLLLYITDSVIYRL